jgi:hypothetical protein
MPLHSLLPCCLLAIVLTAYFLGQPFDDRQLQGQLIIRQLADLSAEPMQQQALRLAAAANARSELAERVHRRLGATRYCGVPQLRAACLLQVAGRCA